MSHVALILLVVAGAVPYQSAYKFQGSLAARQPTDDEQPKKFSMTVVPAGESTVDRFIWIVDERGSGGLSWADHVAQSMLAPAGPVGETAPMSIMLERPSGKALIPLPLPMVGEECPLDANGRWVEGKLEYKVVGTEVVDGKPTVRVEAGNNFGVRRRLWVDPSTRIVQRSSSTIVVGQGEEYELRYQLQEFVEIPAGSEQDTLQRGIASILDLKQLVAREANQVDGRWTAEQLAIQREKIASLAPWQKHKVLGPFVDSIDQEVRLERGKAGAVASMREKAIGRMQGLQGLTDSAGKEISRDSVDGRVVVLHLWDYKDQPLIEPYGQVGYVDFLYRQHKDAGVRVYGVAVDPRWAESSTRRAVSLAAQKLASFMNLTYPMLFDDGTWLKQLGDPRASGNKLPLFVVLDKEGRVVEYHSGHYEVHRDRGLEALDQVVRKALDKRE